MLIYKTSEWEGYGKNNYYWNEYRLEGTTVYKYKCHRQKFFNGKENEWNYDESGESSWDINSDDLPEWIRSYL